jgi:hypothetical protein
MKRGEEESSDSAAVVSTMSLDKATGKLSMKESPPIALIKNIKSATASIPSPESPREWKSYTVVGSTKFTVPSIYHDLEPVGMGTFGLVCSAKKNNTGELKCAIKKITEYNSF